ncbi:streptogrisin B precursor [Streptomyces sp. CNQ-509]|uniref:S1 family peptidase n=1 Tax=unclassified Streptomyces TaxID=2593676 RepID=UPI00062DE6F2|nr:S1 family peptidase [Streptomyces sp. CNQ-509]AKH82519.1 streptogrisin B precursor [Streptomyces sp. CNQ-509]
MSRRRTAPPLRTTATAAVLAVLGALLTVLAPPASASDAGRPAAATAVRGGEALYGPSYACTLGFNAVSGGTSYGIIAGHCADVGSTWAVEAEGGRVSVGVTSGSVFPGSDYGVVRYTNTSVSYPGEVKGSGGAPVDITGAADPAPGMSLCHYGRVGGYRCGTVQAVNLTVNFPGGTVSGLFRSSICSEPGDTGGPAFSGGRAVGIIVGGSGNCTSGGVTYYQPVKEILAAYGLTLS